VSGLNDEHGGVLQYEASGRILGPQWKLLTRVFRQAVRDSQSANTSADDHIVVTREERRDLRRRPLGQRCRDNAAEEAKCASRVPGKTHYG
jgi:hypothetical protein